MKKFIITLLASLALLFVLDRAVGAWLRHIYDTTTHGEVGRIHMVMDSVDAPAIVLGSSRALHHYVPDVMEDSLGMAFYNCGFEAMGIATNYPLLRGMTQRYMPEVILYDATYHYDVEEGAYTRNISKVRRMARLQCRDSVLIAHDKWERLRLLSHIYPYNSTLAELILQRSSPGVYDDPKISKGYIPLFNTLDTATAVFAPEPEKVTKDPIKLENMEEMMKRYHDRLIICASPMFRPEKISPQKFDELRKLCDKYQVPFIDLSDDEQFVGKPELWDDTGHLNDRGARLYTARIAHELKRLLANR